MFAISADFISQTLSYGYKGAVFSSFLKLISDMEYGKIQSCPKHTIASPNNLQTSFSQTSLQLKPKLRVRLSVQRVMSYGPGLVDLAIGQVNSVLNLPDKLVKFFRGIQIVEELQSILLVKNFWGACYNDS